jgi:hypothetical protein
MRKASRCGEQWVEVPGDRVHALSVLPYLQQLHYGADPDEQTFFTQRQING